MTPRGIFIVKYPASSTQFNTKSYRQSIAKPNITPKSYAA